MVSSRLFILRYFPHLISHYLQMVVNASTQESPIPDKAMFVHSGLQHIVTGSEFDFNDIPLEDEPKTDAPPRRNSLIPNFSPHDEDMDGMPTSISYLPDAVPHLHSDPFKPSHKKSASTTTIRSGSNLPFILARLDLSDESITQKRSSVDGQRKLQSEFARQREEEEAKDSGVPGSIDWGASPHRVMSVCFNRDHVQTFGVQ